MRVSTRLNPRVCFADALRMPAVLSWDARRSVETSAKTEGGAFVGSGVAVRYTGRCEATTANLRAFGLSHGSLKRRPTRRGMLSRQLDQAGSAAKGLAPSSMGTAYTLRRTRASRPGCGFFAPTQTSTIEHRPTRKQENGIRALRCALLRSYPPIGVSSRDRTGESTPKGCQEGTRKFSAVH